MTTAPASTLRALTLPANRSVTVSAGDVNIYRCFVNKVFNSFDPSGQNLIVLSSPAAAAGYGHVAEIMGNEQAGYTYYSYGPANGNALDFGTLSMMGPMSYDSAMGYAQAVGYANYQNYATSAAQDQLAASYAQSFDNSVYALGLNDCGNMVADSMNAANLAFSFNLIPNNFFNENPTLNGNQLSSSGSFSNWSSLDNPWLYDNINGCPDANVA